MDISTVQLLFDSKAELAEGPLWHEGALWWVDINAGTLNRLNISTGINTSRASGDFLGAAVPVFKGGWLLARRHELAHFDWQTQCMTTLATLSPAHPRVRFNDGKCDPQGRFFVGTMHRDVAAGTASFYRFEDGRLLMEFEGVTLSNGLDWSPDGSRFYYTDTVTCRVDVLDYDSATGTLANRRPLATIPRERGCPDGLCCDANGNLWVALWGGGCVECLDGLSGKSLQRIPVPARQVSSCCFGGDAFEDLFITSAWENYSRSQREADPLAGGIFCIQPGVRGKAPALAQI
ncbi:MAG: SMP-30/gluconolactonase/LRE family protein [Luteolibacter sp.]